MPAHVVDKIAVARRQIAEATLLFFERRDPIVIHTIVASAHQILIDLGKPRRIESAIKSTVRLRSKKAQTFIAKVNYPYNFFKHADRDADSKIDVGPLFELTQDVLMDAIVMLQRICGELPVEGKIFWHWFVSKNSESFDNVPDNGPIAAMQKQNVGSFSYTEIAAMIRLARVENQGPC